MEDEILEGLQEKNVTAVRRIMIRRKDIDIPTNYLVLTFNSTKCPESLKLGYVFHRVRAYILNSRRCFRATGLATPWKAAVATRLGLRVGVPITTQTPV